MIWFDYFALGFLAYFIIRGFLSGFVKVVFSFIGMVIAFLYTGWLSIKISPFLGTITTTHPKVLSILSYIIAFILIYLSFIIMGFIIINLLGKFNLTAADYILGAFLGFIKGLLFITIFYLALVIPFPSSQKVLNKALTYSLIKYSLKISYKFSPKSWKEFLNKRDIKIE